MKNGLARFEYYLVKLEELLSHAARERNPALWLYNNDARTVLFMLEALAKLYAALHDKTIFDKLKKDFKTLEDALGAVDYYDGFAKEFEKKGTIPSTIFEYLHSQSREKLQRLNDLLEERDWIGSKVTRIKKIRKRLNDIEWMKEDKEVKAIDNFYKSTISKIKSFATKTNFKFTDIEAQAHTLRRKLRWLSIYPKALQGLIQLTDNHVEDKNLVKYLTADVINSPFNKMPDAGDNIYFLMLEKNYFLSLSWMIGSLGNLKDSGLRIIIITEAVQQTKGINQPEALAHAYQLLGDTQPKLTSVLSEAAGICKTYFSEGNLDKLLAGVATVKKQ